MKVAAALAQDDEALFCSGAGFRVLVRMSKGDGQYSLLANGENVPYAAASSAGTDFAGVALSRDTIYWNVNQSSAAVGQALVRVPKAGGEVETLVELDVNGKNATSIAPCSAWMGRRCSSSTSKRSCLPKSTRPWHDRA